MNHVSVQRLPGVKSRCMFWAAIAMHEQGRTSEARQAMHGAAGRFMSEGARVQARLAWLWVLRIAPRDEEARRALAGLSAAK